MSTRHSISYRERVARELKIGKEVLYLTQQECIKTGITTDEVLKFIEAALAAHGRKEVEMPAVIGIHPLQNSLFHAMPAWMPAQSVCGIKWVSSFPDNKERFHLPRTTGLLILNDSESGFPLAIMDAVWITAKRTPAVTAIGAKLLGNPGAETLGMFGCGVQGRGHVRFLPGVMPDLKRIYVFDVLEEAMDSLIRELQPVT
ncbi:MAG: ornithine cyclodeaminase family protein, partial [Candidatus Aerophobetes bacterium]|nr:ornithine cyclodeaminase family protein [Candidatus Aerophobetes bacterium]